MRVVGLFAGIGGIELGFERSGLRAELLCEVDPVARAVLATRFPGVPLVEDVRELDALPDGIEVLCAGFPCQDLSSIGGKAGIGGARSSLVGEVFRLLETSPVEWVVVENVRFMLHLGRGAAMRAIADALEHLGYRWAYRVVNSRAFGVPQRRHRVFLVASRNGDPRDVLFADDAVLPAESPCLARPIGFYWTEGTYATGLADDGVPPLKGGSTVGIPSPPAILFPDGRVVTPDIRDAERLQGFPADWTAPAEEVGRASLRWRLVGNSVTVPVAEWLGRRLVAPGHSPIDDATSPPLNGKWPNAAWSMGQGRFAADFGDAPLAVPSPPLEDGLTAEPRPLSLRATAGFLKRARAGRLRFPEGFLDRLDAHARGLERRSR